MEKTEKARIIKSITEAFSMKPTTWAVCRVKFDGNKFPEKGFHQHAHTPNCIAKIILCNRDEGEEGNPKSPLVYRGYNHDGFLLFEIRAKSVNVFYTHQ